MPVLGGTAIDLHAHFLPPIYREAALSNGQGRPDGMPALPKWEPSAALRMMDDVGIRTSMLSLSSPGVEFRADRSQRADLARAVNEAGAETVRAYPDRFGLMATLPLPHVDLALAEIDRAYDELGADGVGLHTHTDGVYLGDPRLDQVLSALNERRAVVTIHPVSPCGWESVAFGRPRPLLEFLLDTTRAVANLALSEAFTRFPRIRWVVPHAGAALPVVADRVDVMSRWLRPSGAADIEVVDDLGRLYYDLAGIPLPRALPALLNLVAPSQLLYGSDYPFTRAETVRGLAMELAEATVFDDAAVVDVLRANAVQLFPRLAPGPGTSGSVA